MTVTIAAKKATRLFKGKSLKGLAKGAHRAHRRRVQKELNELVKEANSIDFDEELDELFIENGPKSASEYVGFNDVA